MLINDGRDKIQGTPYQIVTQMRYKSGRQYKTNFAYMHSVAKRYKQVKNRQMIYFTYRQWLNALAKIKQITIINP